MNLTITPQQEQFLTSDSRGTIFRGGIGSGKSRILCYKAILNALNKRREAIVSFSYVMLRDVIMHTLQEVFPLFGLEEGKNIVTNKTDMTIKFWTGGEILLRSGDKPDSLRGLNIDDFFIDEGRQFPDKSIHDIMLGRLRKSKNGQWFITSSPRGKDWMWELSQQEGITTIVQSTFDNPFLPDEYIDDLKKNYTSKFAAQELEAHIVELKAGIIDSDWFVIKPSLPIRSAVRFWDIAVSIKEHADYSAGSLCSFFDNQFTIHNIWKGKLEYPQLRKKILEVAKHDGPNVTICLEKAGQQQAIIDDLKQEPLLRNHVIRGVTKKGDKLTNAMPWISRAEMGAVRVIEGPWNREFFDECDAFTADDSHQHDDQVDSVSGAYNALTHKGELTMANLRL